jgi:hypothetical protein
MFIEETGLGAFSTPVNAFERKEEHGTDPIGTVDGLLQKKNLRDWFPLLHVPSQSLYNKVRRIGRRPVPSTCRQPRVPTAFVDHDLTRL